VYIRVSPPLLEEPGQYSTGSASDAVPGVIIPILDTELDIAARELAISDEEEEQISLDKC
jgi:hypothetical protein